MPTTTESPRSEARLPFVDPEDASGVTKELLDGLVARGGPPGPMVRAMANSGAMLRGYVDLSRAMKRSHLDRRITERISLAVQEWVGCGYCIAAHSEAARKLGLSERDIALARQGTATDPRVAAIVSFAQQAAAAPSEITDEDVEGLRRHGYSDEQIAEVAGLVGINVMTGTFNLIAGIGPEMRTEDAR